MEEVEHVLKVLKQAKLALKNNDSIQLKQLSNQTIHSSSIYQDTDNILVAVIIYALSKIIERPRYQEYAGWNTFFRHFLKHIDYSILYLERKDFPNLREELSRIRRDISKLTGDFKKNVEEVFRKAEINKASKIYEHGLSLEKTAKLLGISLWELAEYTGQTGVSEVNITITMPVQDRIKLAQSIFAK
ncbi:MAG: hypothetical protein NT076_05605 [Candidatus Pacearchaeota archaeon]|nr:hypothetical protein [Candidatus Pacearchaeota archaeon]